MEVSLGLISCISFVIPSRVCGVPLALIFQFIVCLVLFDWLTSDSGFGRANYVIMSRSARSKDGNFLETKDAVISLRHNSTWIFKDKSVEKHINQTLFGIPLVLVPCRAHRKCESPAKSHFCDPPLLIVPCACTGQS